MCLAESIQYTTCGCYHGHRILSTCPRGGGPAGSCPAPEEQGVARAPGLCGPCALKGVQRALLGVPAEGGDVWIARCVVVRAMEAARARAVRGEEGPPGGPADKCGADPGTGVAALPRDPRDCPCHCDCPPRCPCYCHDPPPTPPQSYRTFAGAGLAGNGEEEDGAGGRMPVWRAFGLLAACCVGGAGEV